MNVLIIVFFELNLFKVLDRLKIPILTQAFERKMPTQFGPQELSRDGGASG